jgi:hypothetical protein
VPHQHRVLQSEGVDHCQHIVTECPTRQILNVKCRCRTTPSDARQSFLKEIAG